jgi:hypothetical protein
MAESGAAPAPEAPDDRPLDPSMSGAPANRRPAARRVGGGDPVAPGAFPRRAGTARSRGHLDTCGVLGCPEPRGRSACDRPPVNCRGREHEGDSRQDEQR